jgi:hypothetical protein
MVVRLLRVPIAIQNPFVPTAARDENRGAHHPKLLQKAGRVLKCDSALMSDEHLA